MRHPTIIDPDRGAGTLGTSAGVLVFLLLMLATVQVLYNLAAATALTAAAVDATRTVAAVEHAGERCRATAPAEDRFLAELGTYGAHGEVTVSWTCDRADVVRMEVRAVHPSILPPVLHGLLGLGSFERTVEARLEEPR